MLQSFPEDVINYLADFMTLTEIGSFVRLNRSCYNLSRGPFFWRRVVLNHIARVQCPSDPMLWVRLINNLFPEASDQVIVKVFSSFSGPLCGMWMSGLPNPAGELLQIELSRDGFFASRIFATGETYNRFTFSIDATSDSLLAVFPETDMKCIVEFCSGDLLIRSLHGSMYLMSYRHLATSDPLPDAAAAVRHCLGFFVSTYYAHGDEIILTSTRPLIDSCIESINQIQDFCGQNMIYGLKITGDVNVPAGQLSFVVDLGTAYDIEEEVSDNNGSVSVCIGYIHVVTLRLIDRRAQMIRWYKGKCQINRTPGIWAPEWVDADFIVYSYSPDAPATMGTESVSAPRFVKNNSLSFSIFFSEQAHMLDFFSFSERSTGRDSI